MLNFLADPSQFQERKIRLASNRESLYRTASFQLRRAKSITQVKNFIVNLVQTGLAKVRNFKDLIVNAFHKITRAIFISTPVISHLTVLFRKVAYQRVLEGMYDSWRLGVEDSKGGFEERTPSMVIDKLVKRSKSRKFRKIVTQVSGSGYSTEPFYEEYLLGFEGGSSSQLKQKALMLVKKDIGTRTMSEFAKYLFDISNPVRAVKRAMNESKKSDDDIDVSTFVSFFIATILTYESWKFFGFILTSKIQIGLALVGLFYYRPTEAFVKKGKAWQVFKKSLKRETDLFVDDVNLDDHIPRKDVFIEDAMGDFKSLKDFTPEDMEHLEEQL